MSISLSVYFTEPMTIDVASFSVRTNEIFNFLLGRRSESLNITVQNSEGFDIKEIEPDTAEVYRFIETDMMCSGGYILYAPNEYWQYHGDKMFYDFCVTEINFDYKSALFAIELSMLIAVAQYSEVEFLNDTHGFFCKEKEDRVNIKDILDSRLPPNSGEVEEALALFYGKIKRES